MDSKQLDAASGARATNTMIRHVLWDMIRVLGTAVPAPRLNRPALDMPNQRQSPRARNLPSMYRFTLILGWLFGNLIFLSAWPVRAAAIAVDHTEDPLALGYCDSRKIVRDSQGNLYLAYRKKYKQVSSAFYHIFVAKCTNGGSTWTVLNSNRPIESVGDFQQRVPSIAIGSNDIIHVVWYGNDSANTGTNQRQIKYVRSADRGTSWSNWKNIAPVSGYNGEDLWQEHPTIFIDGNNTLYVVWQGKDPTHTRASQAKFSKSTDGGTTWTAWSNINPSSDNRSRPVLVATANNQTLYLMAYGSVNTAQQIVWTRSTDGGATWTAWAAVAASRSDQRPVSVAIDSSDQLHVVWRQVPTASSITTPQIHYARFNGSSWSSPQVLNANCGKYQFFPSIAVTSNNTLWVVWTECTDAAGFPSEKPTDGQIIYVSKAAGGSWSSHTALTTNASYMFASLRWGRHNNEGTIDVVWLNNASTMMKDILYTTL